MIVVGIDGSNDERDAVKAGTLKATVMLQAQAIAAEGVTDLDNFIQKGVKPEKQRVTSVSQTLRDIIFSLAPAFAGATAFNYDL